MILEKARELGLALSETEEFQNMVATRVALETNEFVSKTLQEFKDKQEELVNLLSTEDADRLQIAALSRDVEALQEQLTENPVFSGAMQAQNAFQVLMNQINQEIGACIGMPVSDEDAACSGSCDGCSGCQH